MVLNKYVIFFYFSDITFYIFEYFLTTEFFIAVPLLQGVQQNQGFHVAQEDPENRHTWLQVDIK